MRRAISLVPLSSPLLQLRCAGSGDRSGYGGRPTSSKGASSDKTSDKSTSSSTSAASGPKDPYPKARAPKLPKEELEERKREEKKLMDQDDFADVSKPAMSYTYGDEFMIRDGVAPEVKQGLMGATVIKTREQVIAEKKKKEMEEEFLKAKPSNTGGNFTPGGGHRPAEPTRRERGTPKATPLGSYEKAYKDSINDRMEARQFDASTVSESDLRTMHGWLALVTSFMCFLYIHDSDKQPHEAAIYKQADPEVFEAGKNLTAKAKANNIEESWDGQTVEKSAGTHSKKSLGWTTTLVSKGGSPAGLS